VADTAIAAAAVPAAAAPAAMVDNSGHRRITLTHHRGSAWFSLCKFTSV
jgi:hypothetical protein